MRALIQRTTGASVTVEGSVVGGIAAGLVVLVCAMRGDGEAESAWLARKTVNLRIFRDDQGRMNRSLLDVGGSALIVSQFTLAAEPRGTARGSPPPPTPSRAAASTSISRSRFEVTGSTWPTASSARR